MINMDTKLEIDLDIYFSIKDIKKVTYHNENFYMMTFKRRNKIGYYLVKIDINNPLKY